MRDITLCHPRLQVLATKLVEECSKQGLRIAIGEAYLGLLWLHQKRNPAGKKRTADGVFTMEIQASAFGMLGTMMKKRTSGTGVMELE